MKFKNITRHLAASLTVTFILGILSVTNLAQVVLAGDPVLPDPKLTPGVFFNDLAIEKLCEKGYVSKEHIRNVTDSEKRQVFIRYFGSVPLKTGDYEIDHLISLELGGSNSISNLWPQTYSSLSPYNAHVKDKLENKLASLVRSDLKQWGAQHASETLARIQVEISTNWIVAYQKYVGPIPPYQVPAGREASGNVPNVQTNKTSK